MECRFSFSNKILDKWNDGAKWNVRDWRIIFLTKSHLSGTLNICSKSHMNPPSSLFYSKPNMFTSWWYYPGYRECLDQPRQSVWQTNISVWTERLMLLFIIHYCLKTDWLSQWRVKTSPKALGLTAPKWKAMKSQSADLWRTGTSMFLQQLEVKASFTVMPDDIELLDPSLLCVKYDPVPCHLPKLSEIVLVLLC